MRSVSVLLVNIRIKAKSLIIIIVVGFTEKKVSICISLAHPFPLKEGGVTFIRLVHVSKYTKDQNTKQMEKTGQTMKR